MKHHPIGRKAVMLVGVASSCLFWQSAAAQTAPAPAAATLGEVIVTARKREESVQSIPVAVSVQTAQALQQHQITDSYQLQRLTPSLQSVAGNARVGVPSFTIRGIGTSVAGPQVESSVGVVIDDVAIARAQLATVELFDLDRVEVLRGPQGMLFGKNASAGVINIVTASPKLNQTEFLSHLQYGNMNSGSAGNRYKVDAAGNVPIGDKAALRLTGFYSHDDALMENVFTPGQNLDMSMYGGRAKLLWEPMDNVRLLFSGDYSHEKGLGEAVWTNSFDSPGGFVEGLDASKGIVASDNNTQMSAEGANFNHFKVWGISFKADIDLGGGFTLTNVVGHRGMDGAEQTDSDAMFVDYLSFNHINQKYRQTSEELRIASPTDKRFTYQAGLYYLFLDATSFDEVKGNIGLPPVPGFFFQHASYNQYVTEKSVATFFEGQYKILDSLRLTMGVRYTHDALNYTINTINYPDELLVALQSQFTPLSVNTNNVSYRASLDYDVTEGVMAYLSYAKGYKGPTFDQFADNAGRLAKPVGSEIPQSYEVGLKSTVFDRRLRLNAAFFDETFDGFQTQAADPFTRSVKTLNAGKLKSRGVEVEFTALPLDGLTLSGGLTYNHTEYRGLNSLSCYIGQPAGIGPNLCNPTTNLTSAEGNQLQQAPKWTETLTIRYEHPVLNGWNGFIQGDGYFRSSYNILQIENPHTAVGSTQIYGFGLGVQSDDGRFVVTVFGRNLTDERVPAFISETVAGAFSNVFLHSEPQGDYAHQFTADSFRTFGISFDYRM